MRLKRSKKKREDEKKGREGQKFRVTDPVIPSKDTLENGGNKKKLQANPGFPQGDDEIKKESSECHLRRRGKGVFGNELGYKRERSQAYGEGEAGGRQGCQGKKKEDD